MSASADAAWGPTRGSRVGESICHTAERAGRSCICDGVAAAVRVRIEAISLVAANGAESAFLANLMSPWEQFTSDCVLTLMEAGLRSRYAPKKLVNPRGSRCDKTMSVPYDAGGDGASRGYVAESAKRNQMHLLTWTAWGCANWLMGRWVNTRTRLRMRQRPIRGLWWE